MAKGVKEVQLYKMACGDVHRQTLGLHSHSSSLLSNLIETSPDITRTARVSAVTGQVDAN